MINIVDLRVEYRTNPINVFTPKPRFSWKIRTDKKNLLQTSYYIEVANNPEFLSPIWKSGKVESEASHLIPYGGTALASVSRFFWRVKIADNQGEESPWSETAFFETTILNGSEWQAVFISAEDSDAGNSSAASLLRREFTVSGKIKKARRGGGNHKLDHFYRGSRRRRRGIGFGFIFVHLPGCIRPGTNYRQNIKINRLYALSA